MHELAFAEQILECVLNEAQRFNARCVQSIRLRVGERLGIEPASLTFCLDAISADTIAEGATVEITQTGPELLCGQCGRIPAPDSGQRTCLRCGKGVDYLPDTGLYVESIEIEDENG